MDAHHDRLYISYMGAGELIVFDTRARRVVATVSGVPRVTGVLAVPARGHVYASAAGAHRVAVIDDSTLRIVAEVERVSFPDGIAYAPEAGRVFVSDESGRRELVIDAGTNRAVTRIPLGGEVGNTQYDSVAHRILVAVQTRNQLVAIDPASDSIMARYDLRGADHPHGVYIDAPRRLAFVANEGNATLLVVDLRSMHVTATYPVGDDPDVLAFDRGLRRLYVAAESGVVSVFDERADGALESRGAYRAPHAHSVAVDPTTHLVYLPLGDVRGHPVLRIMAPASE
jgi:DNA-binding beta-propeller fold protein YncE